MSKFMVNRELLLHALEMCRPGLSPREVIQQSSCFIFSEDGYIQTFNEDVAAKFKSPIAITGAIQAQSLLSILMKLKEEDIEVTQTKGELQLRGRGRSMGITMEDDIVLPLEHLEKPGKWHPLPEQFTDAVQFVQECAGKDDGPGKFMYTCIHVHPKWVECYDEYQFARCTIKTGVQQSMLIKQQALQHIVPMGMTHFSETESFMHFRNSSKLVLSCRRSMEPYPSMSGAIKEAGGEPVSLPRAIIEASDRAEVFSSENAKGSNLIHVALTPGKCLLRGSGETGWYKESKKIVYKGKPVEFMVTPMMLRQLVTRFPTDCQVSEKAFRAGTGAYVYITSFAEVKKEEISNDEVPPTKSKKKKKSTSKKKVTA